MGQALIGQELGEIQSCVAELGQPAYRARQIYRAIYRDLDSDLLAITVLPAALREQLADRFNVNAVRVTDRFQSIDGTVRYLLGLEDDKTVEAVFIPEETRDTLCISSQVGCPVDCKFCLTALMGIERNLTAGEIVDQTLTLCREHGLDARKRQLNIVMMGMGEPLLNLENVKKAVSLMSDPDGAGIPLRRITVSTSGIVGKIKEFAEWEGRPKLAISLNASTEESRTRLMPINAKHTLEQLIEACEAYPLRSWERLTFEYVLLDGVNDADADARRVVRLLANIRAKVNLIALNPGPGIAFSAPSPERVESFQNIVKRSMPCFVRRPRGQDIYAACGQLKRTLEAA